MPRQRPREDDAAFDVGANVGDHLGEVLVVGLLLECHERLNDADAGPDHRRELAREDLQRLRLHLLERAGGPALACGGALGQRLRQEPARLQLLAGSADVRRVDDARALEPLGVDCVVCECGHLGSLLGVGCQPVEESKVAVSVKRSFALAEPSRTVMVRTLTGRLAGVPEQLAAPGGPGEYVPTAHVQAPSTCIQ